MCYIQFPWSSAVSDFSQLAEPDLKSTWKKPGVHYLMWPGSLQAWLDPAAVELWSGLLSLHPWALLSFMSSVVSRGSLPTARKAALTLCTYHSLEPQGKHSLWSLLTGPSVDRCSVLESGEDVEVSIRITIECEGNVPSTCQGCWQIKPVFTSAGFYTMGPQCIIL